LRKALFATLVPLIAAAQPAPYSIDATAPLPEPETGYVAMGTAITPDGHRIGLNSQSLTLDGKPLLPVMGEFHYTRFPARYWEEQLLKMKAAGVTIVSTYVIWQHHEEQPGRFDWSGDRDLKRFVELCGKHGLKVFLRPGPWAHAEVRYGGIPDWVVDSMPTRRGDPAYLAAVGRFYREIAAQVKGQLWKDGGPIVGVQVENEYNLTGPGQGREHIAALKTLLVRAGFDVPLYSVTGWDDTIFPQGEVVPVFGGYPDEPWDASSTKLPPKALYAFQFDDRAGKGLGAQTAAEKKGDADRDAPHTPFLSAEFGAGVPTMYRRRPIIEPDDVAAMLPVQLGSGVNLYGYYMFQGGRNPPGSPSRQESTAIGGYNDLPEIGYDFGAPLGQYGEARPVLAKLRPFHAFLQSWGEQLAPMAVRRPAIQPSGPQDLTTLRYSFRSSGDSGFLFVNNHVRQYRMAEQKQVRFSAALPGGTVTFPSKPVDIPSDAYFIWPVGLDLGAVKLDWATAQPLARIGDVTVLQAIDGIPVELSFDGKILDDVTPSHQTLTVTAKDGRAAKLLVLSEAEAQRAWVVDWAGQRRLILTNAQLFGTQDWLELRSIGNPDFKLSMFPGKSPDDGVFQTITGHAKPVSLNAALTPVRLALPAPPVVIGGAAKAAVEPVPETFGDSAAWNIEASPIDWSSVADAYLRIEYQGDVARLFTGNAMLDDHFYTGVPWEIGLKRFGTELKKPLSVTVLPLRRDAPIFLEDGMRPNEDQVAKILSVTITPEYRFRITRSEKSP